MWRPGLATASLMDRFPVVASGDQGGGSGGPATVAAGGEEEDVAPRVLPSGGAWIWAAMESWRGGLGGY
jgi:hypothetical protein